MIYNCAGIPEFTKEHLQILIDSKIPADILEIIKSHTVAQDELFSILETHGEAEVARALKAYRENILRRRKAILDAEIENSSSSPIDSPENRKKSEQSSSENLSETPAAIAVPEKKKKRKKNKKDNHKRKSQAQTPADEFTNSRKVVFRISGGLCIGGDCPCGNGKLYDFSSGITRRYEAKPLLESVSYFTQKLRCNSCSNLFSAFLPARITESQPLHNAEPEAAAVSILARYGLGFPDLRLETLQDYQGHFVSNSTQWAISLEAFLRLKPFFEFLFSQAAEAVSLRVDDAHAKVVSLHKQINAELKAASESGVSENNVRTGVCTTWVVATLQDGNELHIPVTGREHQGEVTYEILKNRKSDKPVILSTDAAAKTSTLANYPDLNSSGFTPIRSAKSKTVSAPLPVQVVHSFCLQHLRLRFEGIKNNHPEEVQYILDEVGKVFKLESTSKGLNHSPSQRLEFHKIHSKPIMLQIEQWLEAQFKQKLAEPNSDLGKAIKYALNQWHGLTEFFRTENVPLDTNACERDVYFTILHRNNSLHYQTANGAMVGDAFMGLFATCRAAKVNPLVYLGALISFASDANANSQNWMPWNYEDRHRELKNARDKEWKEIDAERKAKGYRQCHRIKTERELEDSPPSQIISKVHNLKPIMPSTKELLQ